QLQCDGFINAGNTCWSRPHSLPPPRTGFLSSETGPQNLPKRRDMRRDTRVPSQRPAHSRPLSKACTLALTPIRDTLIEEFSHFANSMIDCFRLERLPAHWKAPPCHGAHPMWSFSVNSTLVAL